MDSETSTPKNFRIQNRRLHVTYRSHIDPKVWLAWTTTKKITIEFYSIVHETGADSYKHTHILIDAGPKRKFTSTNPRFLDWTDSTTSEVIHPHIKTILTAKHWTNSLIYHYKENNPYTNIEKPEDCKKMIETIWKCDNVSQALLTTCDTLKSVGGVIAAFNCKPSDYGIEPKVEWREWQKELYDELKNRPDDRRIIWNYDFKGNSGKSFFSKHMGMYQGAFVSTKANTYHVATSIDEFIRANGNTVLIVIFNFTRQQEAHNVYQALEELKDGIVTSEKYKGRTMFFNSPHVVVFANYVPEIANLTIDRWDIRIIDEDKVVKRYLAGKSVFQSDTINSYLSYSLATLERQFEISNKNSSSTSNNPSEARTLNIKGPLSLAPLAKAAAPQSVPEMSKVPPSAPLITGKWEGNVFVANSIFQPPDSISNIEVEIDNKKYQGRWVKGTFYPCELRSQYSPAKAGQN